MELEPMLGTVNSRDGCSVGNSVLLGTVRLEGGCGDGNSALLCTVGNSFLGGFVLERDSRHIA